MPCFCKLPLARMPSFANMKLQFSPPKIPIALMLAAKMPQLGDAERLDMRVAAVMTNLRMPSISPTAGPVLGLAAQLKIAGGTFAIDDIPKLEAEIWQAAYTINNVVLPKLKPLAAINPLPIMQLAMVAKLKMSIDPIAWDAALGGATPASHSITTGFALKPPQVQLAKLVAGIPPLVNALDPLKLNLADSGTPGLFLGHLRRMAGIGMPTLNIPLGEVLRLVAILTAIADIQQAFGANAMTPAGLSKIAASLSAFQRLPLPSPMPDLSLAEQMDLPLPEDIKYGAAAAGSGLANFGFTPPNIAVMPFMNGVVALRLALGELLDLDPLDACGACDFPLPMFQ